jgi:hypothetical protein
MLLWQIYVAGNNKTYVSLRVNCPMLHWNKRNFICSWPSLDYILDEQIVMTDKSLDKFSLCVAIKHFTRSDGINYGAVSIKYYKCVSVFLPYPACKSHFFNTALYCHLWPVWLCHIFPHYFINDKTSGKKKLLNITCVFWFYILLFSEIFVILRRIQGHITINVHRYLRKVPIIFVRS